MLDYKAVKGSQIDNLLVENNGMQNRLFCIKKWMGNAFKPARNH